MFTVKHQQNGVEQVFSCGYVVHGTDAKKTNIATGMMLEFFDERHDIAHEPIFFGRAWVMNSNGKTVATYHLDKTVE